MEDREMKRPRRSGGDRAFAQEASCTTRRLAIPVACEVSTTAVIRILGAVALEVAGSGKE